MPGRTALTEEQETAVRSSLTHFSKRDRLLILMGLHLGFRVQELLSVTVGQVFDGVAVGAQLRVTRARMKGGAGVRRRSVNSRSVPIHPAIASAIHEYLADRRYAGTLHPDAPLFLSRQGRAAMGRLQANRVIAAVFKRAGISNDGIWGSHSLRKTFAQRVFDGSGHNLELTRAALGHRYITTTQHYLATSETAAAAAILALGPIATANAA